MNNKNQYKFQYWNNLSKFLKHFNNFFKKNLKQLDSLMRESFPKNLTEKDSFVCQTKKLYKKGKVYSEDIASFTVSDPNVGIIGFAQLEYSNDCEWKLINLCRRKIILYRGVGKLLMDFILNWVRENTNTNRLYLNVLKDNQKLQQYYYTTDWVLTDPQPVNHNPNLENAVEMYVEILV